MKKRIAQIGALMVFVALLAGCGRAGPLPTAAAGEASLTRGGGAVVASGTFTEGLVVVGTATVNAEPEVAYVTFGVDVRGDDATAVVDEAARKINAAIAAARELGIAEEDIHTAGYNLWVETVYDPERGVPTGEVVYHLSHTVRATLRDIGRVGDLLAGVVEAGANTISEVSFSAEDPQALVAEARRAALEDAKAKAEQMAEALGIALGRPVLVQELGGGYPAPVVERGVGGGAAMAEVVPPSISPGAFSVTVSVQVVYEIP